MKTVLGAARLKRYIRLVASVVLSALLGLFVGASPTSANAAALEFVFWGGGLVVFPAVLIYTAAVFWIFRGKLGKGYGSV